VYKISVYKRSFLHLYLTSISNRAEVGTAEGAFATSLNISYKKTAKARIQVDQWFPTWGEFPPRGEFGHFRGEFGF